MQTIHKPTAGRLKKVLLPTLIALLILIAAGAALLYWADHRQNSALIYGANMALAPYGVTVIAIDGLQTGLEQARADSVAFQRDGQTSVQHLNSVVIDYELSSLLGGNFSQLTVQSAELLLQQGSVAGDIRVTATNIVVSCTAADNCNGRADISAQTDALSLTEPEIQATALNTAGHIRFDYTAPELRLDVSPGLALSLEQFSVNEADTSILQIEQFSLLTEQAWRLDIDTEQQLLVFAAGRAHMQVPVVRNNPQAENAGLSGFELEILQLNGSYNLATDDNPVTWGDRLTVQATLEATGIYTTLQPFNLWSYRWPLTVQWDAAQNLRLAIDALTLDKKIAGLTLQQNFNDGTGSVQMQTGDLVFSGSADALSTLISPLPLDADLVSGQLSVSSNIGWQMPADSTTAGAGISAWSPGGSLSIRAQNLAGVIDETVFTGLSTSAEFRLQSDLSLASPGMTNLQLQSLDPGFPLNNINTRFQLDTTNTQLALESLSFDMFGGRIDTDPFTVNFSNNNNSPEFGERFDLRVDALDISQVLSLSAYDAVSATGRLSGILPIRLQGLKPVIEGGQLQASPPGGSIRYSAGNAASGNQSLDLVYQALAHYRYETLTAAVTYNETGELTLEMQLQGVSPELNGGQRINLNLNISDNIPALLQSLQAAQSITDRLEELLE